MLEKKEYLGHTVNFKTYKQSYKSKKKLHNPEEKQMIFENTHEPIIDGKRTQQIDICYDLVGILPMSLLKQNSETA